MNLLTSAFHRMHIKLCFIIFINCIIFVAMQRMKKEQKLNNTGTKSERLNKNYHNYSHRQLC